MGIFRKKDKDLEVPVEKPLSEDSVWSAWYELGCKFMAEEDLPGAAKNWCEALARFDGKDKFYEKLRTDIFDTVCRFLLSKAIAGKVVPAHAVAEMDAAVYTRNRSRFTTPMCDDLFYYVKETLDDMITPGEVAMMYISGAYSIIGYLRYSPDLVESIDKCQEVVRLGNVAYDKASSYDPKENKGGIKPKYAASFIATVRGFFELLITKLQAVADDLSEEELAALTAYRREHMDDRLDPLGAALQYTINSVGIGRISKRKVTKGQDEEIADYITLFLKTA